MWFIRHEKNCEDSSKQNHIHDDDIMLLSLAISVVIFEQHDVYEDYELSYDQWNAVLNAADKIVCFDTYDEFVQYFTMVKESTNGKCNLLYYLSSLGAEFWAKKQLHKEEAKDLRRWTELALSPGEKMFVIGF